MILSNLIVQMGQAPNNSLSTSNMDAKSQECLAREMITPSKLSNLKRLTQHGHMDKSQCIHTDDIYSLD